MESTRSTLVLDLKVYSYSGDERVDVVMHPAPTATKKAWLAYAAEKEVELTPADLKLKKKDLIHRIMQGVGF